MTKIPYIYTESCYDTSKQYIKLTKEQKMKNRDYPYNYLPYGAALKNMKTDLKAAYNSIKAVTPEMLKELDEKEREAYKRNKENYIKNSKGIKKYFELYDKLQREDPRFRKAKSENKVRRSIIKETSDSKNIIRLNNEESYNGTENLIFKNTENNSDVVSNINFGINSENKAQEIKSDTPLSGLSSEEVKREEMAEEITGDFVQPDEFSQEEDEV